MTENLCSHIRQTALEMGDEPAIWAAGKQISYSEMDSRATVLANALIASGVEPSDRVCILSNRTDTLYISILAALYAGCTYVCMNPRYPDARNRMILDLSGATGLVIDDKLASAVSELLTGRNDLRVIVTPESEGSEPISEVPRIGRDRLTDTGTPPGIDTAPSSLAYIMFTSGSTGTPKGVPITHANVMDYVSNVVALGGSVGRGDKVIQIADATFDISVHDMFYAWTNGASIISVPANSGLFATRFVEEHGVTHWFAVPSTARILHEAGLLAAGSLPTVRCSFFCGEPLVASVATAWLEAVNGNAVYNLYGPTEGTVAISGLRFRPEDFDPHEVVALGTEFGDNRVELFEPDTARRSSRDAPGEICLSGDQVTPGYWKNPELNAARFFNDDDGRRWYRTGDLGVIDDKKGLVFAGRVDHQVKIRGFRVELSEIEGVIRSATGTGQVAVLPWPLSSDGAPLGCVAFLPMKDTPDTRNAVKAACDDKLPDYMRPGELYFVDELPLNANGKTDYKALEQSPLLT
jgi:D-alanine--poly(phosphoribitol) ligase subunit 1